MTELYIAIGAGVLALLVAAFLFRVVSNRPSGGHAVQEIGALIQEGAMAFLRREYTILAGFVVIIFIVLAVLIDFNVTGNSTIENLISDGNLSVTGPWTAIAYLAGAIGSALAGYIGMNIAVRGNTRTATAAESGLNPALRVAFNSGAVMGLTVVGIGIVGVTVLWLIFGNPNVIAGFGFGASSIALFARVGGGIYTKAADVGADLVGKVEAGLPEDDPRNPAVIADNVGDNVGDVAGMGADLFESYAGSIIATIALAWTAANAVQDIEAPKIVLPMMLAGIGIFASIIGTSIVRTKDDATMGNLLWSLRFGIFGAGILALIGTGIYILMNDSLSFDLFWVILVGLVVGQVIGTATEYFTSYEFAPVKWIAQQSQTGHPSTIIAGIAIGLYSTVIPTIAIAAGIWIAYELAGLYGIGLAAVGMLSTLGITLATDAYGPVADNAGGIAEQAGLDPEVRERTDSLDALGNTTAATGKGFAIGSAVLTAMALMAAYGQVIDIDSFDLLQPKVLIGALVGALLPFLFAGLTMQAVGTAAGHMIEEVRRQFREIPGLREGAPGVRPDAARAVDISTRGSLKAMILPGLIAIAAPILVGLFVGAHALGGMLAGSIIAGFLLAISSWPMQAARGTMPRNTSNSETSAARALIRMRQLLPATLSAIPFKDTSGPAINILLKLMAVVSLIFGPLFI